MTNPHRCRSRCQRRQRRSALGRRAAARPGPTAASVYSVRTTGVYCRPSCAARGACAATWLSTPAADAAEAAGFRPCLRCKPDLPPLAERQRDAVARDLPPDRRRDEAPDLDSLAQAAGMSRFHFHRVFKAHTGITPKAYAAARRGERVRRGLAQGAPACTEALYAPASTPAARFYAGAQAVLGMTPAHFRAGGQRRRDPLRHRRMLAGRDPGGGDRTRASARS